MSKLSRFELGYIVEPQVRQYCGPIFFTFSLEHAEGNVTSNGSFGLVDTGSKKLLVTCSHVWEEFRTSRLEHPELQMCLSLDIGNPVVFDADNLIDCDKEVDLATFDMEPLLSACGQRKFFSLRQNPSPNVKKGDVLFFIGFPGHLRQVVDGALGIGRSSFGVLVSGVDGFRIQSDVTNLELKQADYGGISGCPCFLVRDGRPIQLVGFATSNWKNYLFFTHASRVNPDGTIKR